MIGLFCLACITNSLLNIIVPIILTLTAGLGYKFRRRIAKTFRRWYAEIQEGYNDKRESRYQ